MEIKEKLSDLTIFDLNRFRDARGMLTKFFYSDLFDQFDFKVDDIYTTISHENVVRGLHHQLEPNGQAKLVTCLSGEFWDVVVDLRVGSPTYGEQFSYKLSTKSDESLLIPAGFSHGTISLKDDTVMLSICSGKYMPECESGINISSLNLDFLSRARIEALILSTKDKELPPLDKIL
jgi:dTDP-4-dehydrorhamnose 3,5-epimerase